MFKYLTGTLLMVIVLNSSVAQNKKVFPQLELSYTNPFQKANNFERIGSILGLKGGLLIDLKDDQSIGFNLSSSLFIPNGGGKITSPKILPQARFKFANSQKLYTEVAVGALLNPSTIGYEGELTYNLNAFDPAKAILTVFAYGLSQTFDNVPGELSKDYPKSWLTTVGFKFIKPIKPETFSIVFKPGIGLRGDSNGQTKAVANLAIVFAGRYLSFATAYTNKVPERGFPSYFIASLSVDITKYIHGRKKKPESSENSFMPDPIVKSRYPQSILSY